jgi:hypothetical protein
LEDFKKVPINEKAAVKMAIMKAIDNGRIEHPYRPPYEPINYPPPAPVQKKSFHYGTDDYDGPSPSTPSASQNWSCNVHHTPLNISSQTQANSRFRYASHPKSVATPPPLTPTETASDSILSEGY